MFKNIKQTKNMPLKFQNVNYIYKEGSNKKFTPKYGHSYSKTNVEFHCSKVHFDMTRNYGIFYIDGFLSRCNCRETLLIQDQLLGARLLTSFHPASLLGDLRIPS